MYDYIINTRVTELSQFAFAFCGFSCLIATF